jgi:hypothetical protein
MANSIYTVISDDQLYNQLVKNLAERTIEQKFHYLENAASKFYHYEHNPTKLENQYKKNEGKLQSLDYSGSLKSIMQKNQPYTIVSL